MKLPQLNFPEGIAEQIKCAEQEGIFKIWDNGRKKWLVSTPEEWVRQHCLQYLHALGYPLSLMQTEGSLKTVRRTKRSDILLFRNGAPFILVECKAPTVKISQDTFNQAFNYNTDVNARFIYITNGMQHFFWDTADSQQIETLPSADDPNYG